MNLDEKVDVKENKIYKLDSYLLSILLFDRTTNKNIIWATDMYEEKGIGFEPYSQITSDKITGRLGNIIKPRIEKSKSEQDYRVKDKAEVFTPSWLCNKQNNMVDELWFEEKNVFNTETAFGWKSHKKKIKFNNGKNFLEYITSKRLEISCGEAPYIVSRYDTVSGKVIEIPDRIGLLDRKLRIINENASNEKEWYDLALLAYKSIYAYEYQGDSLLIARENLLYDFIDNYYYKFNKYPTKEMLIEIAEIISWNIFQMDAIKCVIPHSCNNEKIVKNTLFGEEIIEKCCDGCKKNSILKHNGIYVTIMNWDTNRKSKFISLFKKGR